MVRETLKRALKNSQYLLLLFFFPYVWYLINSSNSIFFPIAHCLYQNKSSFPTLISSPHILGYRKQPGVWRQVWGHQLKFTLATRDFAQELQGRKPCFSCEVKTDFPTILLDFTSSELMHLELAEQTKSTHQLQAAIEMTFPPLFLHKEPDKATARSSMSASPNLPRAQLDTASEQPTANTSPDPQRDMAAAHTFTQECLWSQEMMDIFSWCSPWINKQTNTHTHLLTAP